jgi:sporulation protein YlmC with PRC-barrel domain
VRFPRQNARAIALVVFCLANGPALAQSPPRTQSSLAATAGRSSAVLAPGNANDAARIYPAHAYGSHRAPQTRTSKIIGGDVRDVLGERVGDIEDLVIDPSRRQLLYAIISVHGVLGNYDSRYFPVPWPALRPSVDYYVLNIDAARLKAAPSFERDKWPEMTSEPWNASVYEYYNQRLVSKDAAR